MKTPGSAGDRVTVVIVPRESFGRTAVTIDSVVASTNSSLPIVVVDAGSHRRVREEIDARAAQGLVDVIRTEHYLSPNDARSLALGRVHTPYVLFLDNDVEIVPGSIERLLECALETGAGLVAPLYCWKEPAHQIVHSAGNFVDFAPRGSAREYRERAEHQNELVADVAPMLTRRQVGGVEFHAVLADMDLFRAGVTMDSEVVGTRDHLDLSLSVTERGREIWSEPRAVVSYLSGPPRGLADIEYYLMRWSARWNEQSLQRFNTKWNMANDDLDLSLTWLKPHQRHLLRSHRERLVTVFGTRVGNRLMNWAEGLVVRKALRRWQPLTPAVSASAGHVEVGARDVAGVV